MSAHLLPRPSQPTLPPAPAAPQQNSGMSLVNLSARQRMLSQRMALQTVLAARGSELHLKAARASLALFTESQLRLVDTPRHLDAAGAELIRRTYQGPQGVAAVIDAFAQLVGTTLDLAERRSPRVDEAVAKLVAAGHRRPGRPAWPRIRGGGQCAVQHRHRDRRPLPAGGVSRKTQSQRGITLRRRARPLGSGNASATSLLTYGAAASRTCWKRCARSLRSSLRSSAASQRRRSSGVEGDSGGTFTGLRFSSTATMVKKQLFT